MHQVDDGTELILWPEKESSLVDSKPIEALASDTL
jgi:hypothetical protein